MNNWIINDTHLMIKYTYTYAYVTVYESMPYTFGFAMEAGRGPWGRGCEEVGGGESGGQARYPFFGGGGRGGHLLALRRWRWAGGTVPVPLLWRGWSGGPLSSHFVVF